ncbi:hypothetical protein ABHA11_12590 [Enterococcus faecium]|uniref:hypothetical protein n=1 Tax=Enterococcus faecium TaxID=1352 RepID=UPI001E60C254|nr:hypothetical protein [Enterococcus faecium]MDB7359659.1 hypothetical protein [Enterococcus faecium]MDB7377784.1 hypothetical protein [Enterococcus faecium]MDB7380412.1 hypothetical protein [Enterococcus faecium]MDB7385545.1 hypothetical protein [Enterococcus faecium]MDB7388229.1 hypothetical protein [Enterococcus faecium]
MFASLIDSGWSKDALFFKRPICYTYKKKIMEEGKMDPNIVDLSIRLAEVGAKNTATSISNAIRALKAERDKTKTIAGMNELIYELLDEKQELEGIAKSYAEELVAQKLTESDLEYVVDTVIPVLKEFFEKLSGNEDQENQRKSAEAIQNLEALEPLLSLNTLTVLQTLGFNFKKGIGEPLTDLTRNLISGKNKENQTRLNELAFEREIEYFKLIQDEEAFERFMSLRN